MKNIQGNLDGTWSRIVKKSKEGVLIRINNQFKTYSWDQFNTMFIMHPQNDLFAKLKDSKRKTGDSVDDLLNRAIVYITDNKLDIDDMEDSRQAILAIYITDLQKKMRCSREEVRDLIKKRMSQILNKDQNFREQAREVNKQVSKGINRQSKGKFTIGQVMSED